MQKAEAMTAKQCRARGKMSLSSVKKDESNTKNDINLDQAENKYPLQL